MFRENSLFGGLAGTCPRTQTLTIRGEEWGASKALFQKRQRFARYTVIVLPVLRAGCGCWEIGSVLHTIRSLCCQFQKEVGADQRYSRSGGLGQGSPAGCA